MSSDLAISSPARGVATGSGFVLPAAIADQGQKAAERFFTFFTNTIPNDNTRAAYYRNALRFFAWTARHGLTLPAIRSYHVAAYVKELGGELAAPSVKQHLASLRMLFDWLVTGQVIESNPAAAVRAPSTWSRRAKRRCSNPTRRGNCSIASRSSAARSRSQAGRISARRASPACATGL